MQARTGRGGARWGGGALAPALLAWALLAWIAAACAPAGTVIEVGEEPSWRSDWSARPEPSRELDLTARPVVTGLRRPVDIQHAGDGSGRLFVVQQEGTVVVVEEGRALEPPFLDLRDRVGCCGEQGLLGFAAHPDFARNGLFFVHYTNEEGASVLARYRVSADDPDRADPDSEAVLLEVPQPGPVHNGGQIRFGPDGYLYVGLGEGEYTPDWLPASRRAQDPTVLLGKLLRLDVDRGPGYAVPPDNPFAGREDARGEIWALGLRNPWRFSFDRAGGDLYVADVGQTRWEEIDRLPRGAGEAGRNFGWPLFEGPECRTDAACSVEGHAPPILAYGHDEGCATVGGFVYRGEVLPELRGSFLFGDFCSGRIWRAREGEDGWEASELFDTETTISTFGEDEAGELYFADYATGVLYRIGAAADAAP